MSNLYQFSAVTDTAQSLLAASTGVLVPHVGTEGSLALDPAIDRVEAGADGFPVVGGATGRNFRGALHRLASNVAAAAPLAGAQQWVVLRGRRQTNASSGNMQGPYVVLWAGSDAQGPTGVLVALDENPTLGVLRAGVAKVYAFDVVAGAAPAQFGSSAGARDLFVAVGVQPIAGGYRVELAELGVDANGVLTAAITHRRNDTEGVNQPLVAGLPGVGVFGAFGDSAFTGAGVNSVGFAATLADVSDPAVATAPPPSGGGGTGPVGGGETLTTAQGGNLHAGATWVGGVPPKANQKLVINHPVVVSQVGDATLYGGLSGAPLVEALSFGAGGSLEVAPDATLRLRTAGIRMAGPGGIVDKLLVRGELELVTEAASELVELTPAADTNGQGNRVTVDAGVDGREGIIRVSGPGRGQLRNTRAAAATTTFGSMYLQLTRGVLQGFGDATTDGVRLDLRQAGTVVPVLRGRAGGFIECGRVVADQLDADGSIDLADFRWESTRGTQSYRFAGAPGRVRQYDGVVVDGAADVIGVNGSDFHACVFGRDFVQTPYGGGPLFKRFLLNTLFPPTNQGVTLLGDTDRTNFIIDTVDNPHTAAAGGGYAAQWRDPYFFNIASQGDQARSDTGENVVDAGANGGMQLTVLRPRKTHTPAGYGNGDWLIGLNGASGSKIIVRHATVVGEGSHVGETYRGHAGILELHDCLHVNPAPSGFTIATDHRLFNGAAALNDIVIANDNASYNLGAAKYKNCASTLSIGSRDVLLTQDPCVDMTRNALTWMASLGRPATRQEVRRAFLTSRNGPRSAVPRDPRVTAAALQAYVDAGLALNASGQAAVGANASDGTARGAVQPGTTTPPPGGGTTPTPTQPAAKRVQFITITSLNASNQPLASRGIAASTSDAAVASVEVINSNTVAVTEEGPGSASVVVASTANPEVQTIAVAITVGQ